MAFDRLRANVFFLSNRSCRLSPTPPIMKMGAERRTGNHKGCPYDRFAGAYFQRNDRERRPDCGYNSVLPTPVKPSRERGFPPGADLFDESLTRGTSDIAGRAMT